MKKIILSLISGLFLFSQTASAVGVNIGVSGTMGLFAASGSESQSDADGLEGTTKQEAREYGAGGWGSIFVEGTMGKLTLGVDYVSDVFSTETAETHKNDQQTEGSDSVTAGENRVQVDFEELTTIYASVALTDNFYVKGGLSTIDVITNESLHTGSSYGNTSLDGTSIGMGYNHTMDNGVFIRAESNYINFDGVTLTSNDNTIKLKNLDGVTGAISIGKSF